jgi:hypothetical protein
MCDKNSISMDLTHSNNSTTSQSKKIEKIETPKYKNPNPKPSNEGIRDLNKNSYFTKYIEESNRAKLNNKKNLLLKQPKLKMDQKEIVNNNMGLYSNRKKKNNSMDKNSINYYNINNNNNYTINTHHKKNLSIAFNENKNNCSKTPKGKTKVSNSNSSLSPIKSKASENKINLKEDSNKTKVVIPKIKDLSKKENAYLILSYSKCLRLTERMIFARSSPKLREAISKRQILDTNKLYLTEKVKELYKKVEICDEKLKNKFTASKTAEMTLNFITNNIENEFKLNILENFDEKEKMLSYNYVKLLYLLLDENYENIKNENLIKELSQNISNRGFSTIKDYIYFIYIKNSKENKIIDNIDKIKNIISDSPKLMDFNNSIKSDNKFVSYSCYLFKEIINFVNEKVDTFNLKNDCVNLIGIVNSKINLYIEKNK